MNCQIHLCYVLTYIVFSVQHLSKLGLITLGKTWVSWMHLYTKKSNFFIEPLLLAPSWIVLGKFSWGFWAWNPPLKCRLRPRFACDLLKGSSVGVCWAEIQQRVRADVVLSGGVGVSQRIILGQSCKASDPFTLFGICFIISIVSLFCFSNRKQTKFSSRPHHVRISAW